MTAGRRQGVFRIGAIAEAFAIHPQTLRLYEREGPAPGALGRQDPALRCRHDRRLEIILTLTRDLGVNLAGVRSSCT
jgi:MerR family transcriptional regulator/heat shock protein HspR